MRAFAIVGASVLGKAPFVERLVEALRIDGRSVSIIKHAPDGFDIDQPGKASYVRREAGAREVMLVGDRRLVLLREYGASPEPPLAALLARLEPVDLVIVEGFHGAQLPTLEVHRPSSGRRPRWPTNPLVAALVSDEPIAAPLPRFAPDDFGAIADFIAARGAMLRRPLAAALVA
jgi:molybdopterin-guanine dinucleotide biosynthesis protein MobB